MAQETNQPQGPMLCTTGCGFYGNPRNNGMCSVCYKEFLQRQQNSGQISPSAAVSGSTLTESISVQSRDGSLTKEDGKTSTSSPVMHQMTAMCISRDERRADTETVPKFKVAAAFELESSQSSSEGERTPEKPKQKKSRCFTCRRKLGLTGFSCRCGNLFCGMHRYSDKHDCSYDYKSEAVEKIRKENPVVVAEKIQKL